MHNELCHLGQMAYDNRASLETLAWLLLSAVIVTMPEPGSQLSWRTVYTWIYDALHQFSNMKRPTGPATAPGRKEP